MSSTALERLRNTSEAVDVSSLDAFVSRHPNALLLVAGDPVQRPEVHDAAVVVRELARGLNGVGVGVVSAGREDAIKARLNVAAVPAVLFFHNGAVARSLERMQDWAAYAGAARDVFGEGGAS